MRDLVDYSPQGQRAGQLEGDLAEVIKNIQENVCEEYANTTILYKELEPPRILVWSWGTNPLQI